MRQLFLITVLLFPANPASAGPEHAGFFGVWGTHKQCSRDPIKSGGTKLAQPYEVSERWLKHGSVWCSLNWGPVERRKDGAFTAAHARCGEDSLRDYFLGMELSGKSLRLRWGFPRLSEPLMLCSKQ